MSGHFGKSSVARADNVIFWVNYRLTVWIHLFFSLVLTFVQFFGDSIDCSMDTVDKNIVDSYCWTIGTWTLDSSLGQEKYVLTLPSSQELSSSRVYNGKVYHRFYQIIPLFLLALSVLFYLPRLLWKHLDDGRVDYLAHIVAGDSTGVTFPHDLTSSWSNSAVTEKALKTFKSYQNSNGTHYIKFMFCELWSFGNIFICWTLHSYLIGDKFHLFGFEFATFVQEAVTDSGVQVLNSPLNFVFPRLVKCTFYKYGYSSSPQLINGVCVLPINLANERVYCFLWFWYFFLTCLTAVGVLTRLLTIICRSARRTVIYLQIGHHVKSNRLYAGTGKLEFADWFLVSEVIGNSRVCASITLVDALALDNPVRRRRGSRDSIGPSTRSSLDMDDFTNGNRGHGDKGKKGDPAFDEGYLTTSNYAMNPYGATNPYTSVPMGGMDAEGGMGGGMGGGGGGGGRMDDDDD